jgi:hypothetical protein
MLNLIWGFVAVVQIGRSLEREFRALGEHRPGDRYGRPTGLLGMIAFLLGAPGTLVILYMSNSGLIYASVRDVAGVVCGLSGVLSLIAFVAYWVRMAAYTDRLRHGSGDTPSPPIARRVQ